MAKGDITAKNAGGTLETLAVGTDGKVLMADAASTLGVKWETASGTGDVVGPAGATEHSIAVYNGATGKIIESIAVPTATNQYLKCATTGPPVTYEWATVSGSGDVLGPTTSTDHSIARFNGTDNKTIQGSGVIIDDSNNVSGMGTLGCGAITSTGQLTLSVASTPIVLSGATNAKILVTHTSGLQIRNAGDTTTAPIYCSTANCSQINQTGGAANTLAGNIDPGTDATYTLGTSTNGYSHLYLGGATSADIHGGVDIAFRNMADSAYQNIDVASLKVAGTTVINSSGIVSNQVVGLTYVIDGGGSAITTGSKGFLEVPFAMTITGWTIVANASGSIVVDVKRSTYSGFPTTSSIAGTEKPTLSSVQKNQDLSLSFWTTSIAAGDILEFNVDSATTVTRVTVSIRGTRA